MSAGGAPKDLSRRRIPSYIVLDLDRCIADTDRLQHLLIETIGDDPIAASLTGTMECARRETEKSGGSFDTARWTIAELSNDGQAGRWQAITAEFIYRARAQREQGDTTLFMPGASELFSYLQSERLPYGIITYGGEEWQRLKLAALGLEHTPVLITDQKQKGRVIAGWLQDNGFSIPKVLTPRSGPSLRAASVTLLDDKASSFKGLPAGANGLYVKNQRSVPSQLGTVPKSVATVGGLSGAVEALRQMEYRK